MKIMVEIGPPDHSVSATYWNNSVNQPCPKGWRLPTKDEFLSIVPSSQKCRRYNILEIITELIAKQNIMMFIMKKQYM